jgi:nitrate/nitrite-specific signal transduction histidine kinase
VEMSDGKFRLAISDDGGGISPERLERPATLHALRQRAEALGAEFGVECQPGAGTHLTLAVPVPKQRGRKSHAPAADNFKGGGHPAHQQKSSERIAP